MRFALAALATLLVAPQEDLDRRMEEFASKIDPGTDETVARFKKALKAPPGKIALRERVEKAADALRRRAERDALPDFFASHFTESEGRYQLRAGREEWRRRLLDGHAIYLEEVARITPFLRQVASEVADEPGVTGTVKKLLSHESSPHLFYVMVILGKSRPTVYTFQKELGELFVMAEDGSFTVAESRMELGKQYARVGNAMVDGIERAADALKKAAETLAPFDDLHKRLKEVAGDPLFAAVILKGALKPDENDLEGYPDKVKAAVDELLRRLPEVFRDSPQGKVLVEDKCDGVEEALKKYDELRKRAAPLRDPAREFASRIRGGDDVSRGFKRLLQCDAVIVSLDHVGENIVDPVAALKGQIDKVLVKGPDGKYRVPADKAEEVGREIKDDPAAFFRKADRELKLLALYGEKVADPKLREVFTSRYGAYEVEQQVKGALLVKAYDGLSAWIGEHFTSGASGHSLKASSRPEIEAILSQVDALEKEGKKNDLKD
jgi:hypothetical protein